MEDRRPAVDGPDETPEVDQDGTDGVERWEMGSEEYAVGKQRSGRRADTDPIARRGGSEAATAGPGHPLGVSLRAVERTIREAQARGGQMVDVIVAGDFNRHDQLWGGDAVSQDRQGEADPIIDLMNEHCLGSMLPRGTKTWHARQKESTIDLVLASEDLVGALVKYTPHETDHGSDHQAVETWLDVAMPRSRGEPRLLFKNAPWKEINEKVASRLSLMAAGGSVQQQTDRLMVTVLETVCELTPKAKPSTYAKRWWTSDLTQLRRIYTYWRNRAKSSRRASQTLTLILLVPC